MSGEHAHDEYAEVAPVEAALVTIDQTVAYLSERVGRLTAQVVALEALVAVPDAPQDIYDYIYGGKPSAPQVIGRRYTRLDLSELDPTSPGLELSLRYVNITPLYAAGKTVGAIRPRLVRADSGDFTAYDDIEISRDALDDDGVATLMAYAVEKAREVRPEIKLGICGEHGGDPSSIAICERLGLDYVSCSPTRIPVARLAAAHARVGSPTSGALAGTGS